MGQKPQGLVRRLRVFARDTMVSLGVVDKRRSAVAWEAVRRLPDFDAVTRCNSISLRCNVETFIQAVDAVSLHDGRPIWVDKTPDHLFYVKRIRQYIPDAIFIHIIRNGRDTVASLVDAATKYPEIWGWPETASLEYAVQRWNVALRESLQYRGDPRHYVVRYEELVLDPAKVLSGLCGFLGCVLTSKWSKAIRRRLAVLFGTRLTR
jgi:Sulfotransferase family